MNHERIRKMSFPLKTGALASSFKYEFVHGLAIGNDRKEIPSALFLQ